MRQRAAWLRLGVLIAWGVLIVVVGVRLGFRPEKNSLFPTFYRAGVAWRQGAEVYAPAAGKQAIEFRYSPVVAAFFGLFSGMPLRAAQYVWMVVGVGILVAGLWKWLNAVPRGAGQLAPDERWAVALLATPLLVGNINNLQANLVLAGLLMLGCAWTSERRWWLAAIALAVAGLLKVYPLALGLILAVQYPRQLSWRLAMALGVGALLPFLCQSPGYVSESYRAWSQMNALDSRANLALSRQYQDLTVLWRGWIGPLDLWWLRGWQVATALAVGGVGLWARWWRLAERGRIMFLYGLVIGWMLLGGPSTESATYMLAGPLAAWLVVEAAARRQRVLIVVAWAGYALLIIAQMSGWFPFGAWFKALGWQPVGVLVLMVGLVMWLRCRSGTTPGPEVPIMAG